MTFKFTKPAAQFNRMINKLSSISIPYLILFSLLTDIIITCIFSFILFPDNTSGPEFGINIPDFLLVVILAPLAETAIVQVWVIKTTLKYSNNNKLIAVLVSAIIFGLGHHYSIAYILKGAIAGAIYGILWFSISGKQKKPFLYVALTHSIYNLIGFIITAFT